MHMPSPTAAVAVVLTASSTARSELKAAPPPARMLLKRLLPKVCGAVQTIPGCNPDAGAALPRLAGWRNIRRPDAGCACRPVHRRWPPPGRRHDVLPDDWCICSRHGFSTEVLTGATAAAAASRGPATAGRIAPTLICWLLRQVWTMTKPDSRRQPARRSEPRYRYKHPLWLQHSS